jgi:hypothetical protein
MAIATRAGRGRFRPLTLTVVAVSAAVLALSGCARTDEPVPVGGTAGPAGFGSPSRSGSEISATATPAVGPGCTAGGAAVPKDSNWVGTDDLDGDGLTDQLWLAHDDDLRLLGVTTASGARFSIILNQYDAGAEEQRTGDSVSAVAGRLSDGSAVIMVDFGRSAGLYSVVNCYVVALTNVEGRPYLFDRGYAGTGDGAGCPVAESKRVLVGYLAEYNSTKNTYRVTRTAINVDTEGRRATNGRSDVLGTGLPEGSTVVNRAQSVTCGDNNIVSEPAS